MSKPNITVSHSGDCNPHRPRCHKPCQAMPIMKTNANIPASQRSGRTGAVICKCGRGYGSEFDGKCIRCRKGVTAWDAMLKSKGLK